MPAKRKAPGARQVDRPQRRAELGVVRVLPSSGGGDVPAPPEGLLRSSRDRWAEFWAGPVSKVGEPIDRVLVERWILAHDEWLRAVAAVREARVVKGSTGQPVLNPLAAWVRSREDMMRTCEVQLGIGLKSRADLGITMGQARMTAAELNRMTEEDVGDEDRGEVIDVEEVEVLGEFSRAE